MEQQQLTRCHSGRRYGFFLLLLAGWVIAAASPAGAAGVVAKRPATGPAPGASSRDAAQKLILQLDSPNPKIRETAALQLNSLDGDALGPVEEAVNDDGVSPESRGRLKTALKYLRPRAVKLKQEREAIDWLRREFWACYQAGGHRNAKYDEDVAGGIEWYSLLGPEPASMPASLRAGAIACFADAIKSGCDDPVVLFLNEIVTTDVTVVQYRSPANLRICLLADNALKSQLTPMGNFLIAEQLYVCARTDTPLSQKAIATVKDLGKRMPIAWLDQQAELCYEISTKAAPLSKFQAFYDGYKLCDRSRGGQDLVEGRILLDRGIFEGNYSPPGIDPMAARLKRMAEAEKFLVKAWEAAPGANRAACVMIALKTNQLIGGGERAAIETWYERAITADPDSIDACNKKLSSLHPEWGGSIEEMINFGRECLATQNWRGGIPYTLVDAHVAASKLAPDTKAYFATPEVWEEIRSVFEGAVLNFPSDVHRRSQFAFFAGKCGHWDVAHRQFEALGDNAVASDFGSQAQLDYYRRKAKQNAGDTTQPAQ